ncbi:MAG: bacteriohemerythrin [Lachnospiraceae bacterium]
MYNFTDDCVTGIAMIDDEHRGLFDTINQAFRLLGEEGDLSDDVKKLLDRLKEYADTHFEHEEAYMREINDPELARQKKEHQSFREKLGEFSTEKLEKADCTQALRELLEYLSRWLYRHILGSDIMIGKFAAKEEGFKFTERFYTGIGFVDEEHSTLFDIINEAHKLIYEELLHDKYDRIVKILEDLKDYTIRHFNHEEEYMTGIGYTGLAAQKAAHQAFIDRLDEVNLEEMDDNQQEYLEELVEFLKGWLVNHIVKMDKLIPGGE